MPGKLQQFIQKTKTKKQEALAKQHKYLVNHLTTRFFDSIGIGDNILATLSVEK